MGSMLPYIAAPWILWVMNFNSVESVESVGEARWWTMGHVLLRSKKWTPGHLEKRVLSIAP
jgi:hypothetical protein